MGEKAPGSLVCGERETLPKGTLTAADVSTPPKAMTESPLPYVPSDVSAARFPALSSTSTLPAARSYPMISNVSPNPAALQQGAARGVNPSPTTLHIFRNQPRNPSDLTYGVVKC